MRAMILVSGMLLAFAVKGAQAAPVTGPSDGAAAKGQETIATASMPQLAGDATAGGDGAAASGTHGVGGERPWLFGPGGPRKHATNPGRAEGGGPARTR